MITLNTLKITTLAVITALSLNACKSTSSTQQTAASRVSIADGNARAEAYLNEAGKKIKMAIANGDITEEEGRLKYAAVAKRVEKRMAGSKSKTANTDARAMRAKYKEASDKMTEMVKSGEITREQMQTRLDGMKKRMGADKSKKISKEDYDLAASKMARMVKAGEITREQMEARLNRMKKAMASKEERSDDCIELRKKLGEAVRNGKMTREEAGKIWEEEGC
jgi:polyhydroxyalkanoate synthesis regulator phasin